MLQQTHAQSGVAARDDWRRFVDAVPRRPSSAACCGAILFILLLDPYDMVPFSLPIERPLVSGSQRFAYPQVMRSERFDSLIVGSSTARLIDPEQLNGPFARALCQHGDECLDRLGAGPRLNISAATRARRRC